VGEAAHPDGSGWRRNARLRRERFPGRQPAAGGVVGAGEASFWDGLAYLFALRVSGSTSSAWFLRKIGGLGDFFGSHGTALDPTYLIAAPKEFGNTAYVYDIGPRP